MTNEPMTTMSHETTCLSHPPHHGHTASRPRVRASTLLRRWGAPLAIGAAIATMGALYSSANAVPQATQAAAPTRVAVVDIMTLINGLSELKDRNNAMKPARDQMRAELDQLEQQVKALEGELKDNIPKGETQRRIEKLMQLQEANSTFKVRNERFEKTLDILNAQVIRELYAKCATAINAFAEREGFDLVILDDRPVTLTEVAGMGKLGEDVLMKRILFAGSSMDITQRVLTVMENEYTQGKATSGNP